MKHSLDVRNDPPPSNPSFLEPPSPPRWSVTPSTYWKLSRAISIFYNPSSGLGEEKLLFTSLPILCVPFKHAGIKKHRGSFLQVLFKMLMIPLQAIFYIPPCRSYKLLQRDARLSIQITIHRRNQLVYFGLLTINIIHWNGAETRRKIALDVPQTRQGLTGKYFFDTYEKPLRNSILRQDICRPNSTQLTSTWFNAVAFFAYKTWFFFYYSPKNISIETVTVL